MHLREAFHGRELAFSLGLKDGQVAAMVNFVGALYRAFTELDASLVEINPLVVRLEGTNVELGRKILSQSGLPLQAADNFEDAARKVVAAAQEAA